MKHFNKQEKFDQVFMGMADKFAEMSNCVKYQVSCIVTKDNRIVINGYNGTPSGFTNCDDKFDPNNYDSDDHRKWSNNYELHAEMNALIFAAKNGIPVDGCTMYVTMQPCHNCLKHMAAAGIKRIVYRQVHHGEYPPETQTLIQRMNLKVEHLP